jgi:hypothetical protein
VQHCRVLYRQAGEIRQEIEVQTRRRVSARRHDRPGVHASLDSPLPKGHPGEAFGWTMKVADFNPDADDVVEQAPVQRARPQKGLRRSDGSIR